MALWACMACNCYHYERFVVFLVQVIIRFRVQFEINLLSFRKFRIVFQPIIIQNLDV